MDSSEAGEASVLAATEAWITAFNRADASAIVALDETLPRVFGELAVSTGRYTLSLAAPPMPPFL